tara:strand:- start:117 stop:230 length:114 start_codon:yes stop_codon:yes gene_type:complete
MSKAIDELERKIKNLKNLLLFGITVVVVWELGLFLYG